MSPDVQVKLLRVLEERTIERLGDGRPVKVDARIIAATNRNLEEDVRHKRFREDLFYRLNVFPIRIPPLRERVPDIQALAWRFIDEMSTGIGGRIESIANRSLHQLERYAWPGNVRELRNVIERALILAAGPVLMPSVPSPLPVVSDCSSECLTDVQIAHIRSVLESCSWRIRGTHGAAQRLGLPPTTLETRMARLGIVRATRSVPS